MHYTLRLKSRSGISSDKVFNTISIYFEVKTREILKHAIALLNCSNNSNERESLLSCIRNINDSAFLIWHTTSSRGHTNWYFLCHLLAHPVFLTYVGIRQMPTWLPTWKAKSLYHVGTFLPTWFFLPLQKFKTIKIKWEKNLYTQANTCLLHISRNFKDIFKYIWFTPYRWQTVNIWERSIVFIDRRCLPCFVLIDIRSNQFRVDLI